MTQKSFARKQRDLKEKARNNAISELKGNTCWDDLNKMYSEMCGLLSSHSHIRVYADDKELIAMIADKATLASNIRILARDLATLNVELKAIYDTHKDMSGGTTDPDVVISTFPIFEQYNLFMERHQAVIMPTAYHIIEQFSAAEVLLASKKQDEANGIVDAEIITTEPVVTQTEVVAETPVVAAPAPVATQVEG